MSQKLEFIEKAKAPGANISALCGEYGISRQTGYKWLRRFRAEGYTGLVQQSRRPHVSPLATAEEAVVRYSSLETNTGAGGRTKSPGYFAGPTARMLRARAPWLEFFSGSAK
jgi:transposase-like protein